jgi:Tfp pilus assembly protein PilV
MHDARTARPHRGVSLIEAVVALAVMAIGLLGVAGVQATLRANSDVTKQRAEAVRLAQQKIEGLRSFRDLTGGGATYVGLDGGVPETILPIQRRNGSFTSNTTFTRTTRVTSMGSADGAPDLEAVPRAKSVTISVSWADSSGQLQSVRLTSAIAGIAPALAGSLAVPPDGGTPVRQPSGRDRGIPSGAKNLGDGTSVWKPPVTNGTVAWRFNNADGLVTLCRVASTDTTDNLTLERLAGACTLGNARFLGGYVRYALNRTQPVNLDALRPGTEILTPQPLIGVSYTTRVVRDPLLEPCITQSIVGVESYTAFYCAIPVTVSDNDPTPRWSGKVVFGSNGDTIMATAPTERSSERFRACRYAATLATYTEVLAPQALQNFLIIRAGDAPEPPVGPPESYALFSCPAPSTALFQPTS